ncbi:MAG: hypothetical protein K6G58_04535 [Lachnospiraceae bacterium]|nr:hypothetical protein [Lachnospiraceae bacterium]
MKRCRYILVLIVIICVTAGCGKDKEVPADVNPAAISGTEEVPADVDPAAISGTEEVPADVDPAAISGTEEVPADVDLTVLSSTMVYAEVYHMMVSPEDYIGRTVKMAGVFSSYHDYNTGKDYFACIISDATACCSQGIEFELTDDYIYPDDYPEEGGEICVAGVFDTYEDGDYTYCILREARIETEKGSEST